jgi:hypothetical protein
MGFGRYLSAYLAATDFVSDQQRSKADALNFSHL